MFFIKNYDPSFIKKCFLSFLKGKAMFLNIKLVFMLIPLKGHAIIYIPFTIFSIHHVE